LTSRALRPLTVNLVINQFQCIGRCGQITKKIGVSCSNRQVQLSLTLIKSAFDGCG
jgi:hypothetical protein